MLQQSTLKKIIKTQGKIHVNLWFEGMYYSIYSEILHVPTKQLTK